MQIDEKTLFVLNEEIYGQGSHFIDVKNEEFYKNPKITLYDELEVSAHELICDFAQLIGVHLNKEDCGDYHLTMEVRDFIINLLEKEFKIPFPVYSSEETEQKTTFSLKSYKENNLEDIIKEYEIIVSDVTLPDGSVHQAWCWDDSIDTLFADNNIIVGETYDKKKEFVFQENLGPVGCDYNDYLHTIELFQNNEEFLFPVHCIWNGNEADKGIVFDNPISL